MAESLPLPCPMEQAPSRGAPAGRGVYLYYPHLLEHSPLLAHAVFTRQGGVSQKPFASLNTGRLSGDDPVAVEENRRRIREVLAAPKVVYPRQDHGTRVQVYAAAQGDLASCPDHPDAPADALVTDIPGLFLAIQVADCQPVFLYDPQRRVVANIHSGWRGSVQNILGRTVFIMQQEFGCDPTRLLAGIGPSLGPCCAEFVNYQHELPAAFRAYREGRCHFNFWRISVDQLIAAGLREENIRVGGLCTRCRSDLFFSYRGEKTTGRFAALIGLTVARC